MQTWQMQDAEGNISKLVECAQEQPQVITVKGKSVAVVISADTFDRLLSQKRESFVDFMRRSPLHGEEDVNLERDQSMTREILL